MLRFRPLTRDTSLVGLWRRVTGFGLANPKLYGERDAARQILHDQPADRPTPGIAVVTDKGLSGEETEAFFASPDLGLILIRPARKDETTPRPFPNWLIGVPVKHSLVAYDHVSS
jgi:hypothetical protein